MKTLKLHIGGSEPTEGWQHLGNQAGADYVGDIYSLAQFSDASCSEIYIVHVLQHVDQGRILPVLAELRRILVPGGKLMVSVPSLDALCALFVNPTLDKTARHHVMRMIYGGQTDVSDYNNIGLSYEILTDLLAEAGFATAQKVDSFGLFNDASNYAPYGVSISLNIIAINVGTKENALESAEPPVPVKVTVPRPEQETAGLSIAEILEGEIIHIVDIGASSHGELTEPYAALMKAGVARVVGFEPDAQAHLELTEMYADNPAYRYYPHFVGKGGAATFYETNWHMTGSLYKPNKNLLDKFYQIGEVTQFVAEHAIETVRLDDLDDLGDVDLIKIDVQGAELDVFTGGKKALSQALAVWMEVEFVEYYQGQPLFADVDQFMRSQGFIFHCFAETVSRSFNPLYVKNNPYLGVKQLIWGDAIYVKDFQKLAELDLKKLRKLAVILDSVVHSPDYCLLVLQEIDKQASTRLAEAYYRSVSDQFALTDPLYPVVSAALSPEQIAWINQQTSAALDLQEQNRLPEATALFKEILLLNPNHFPALYSLSVIASKAEQHAEALSYIEKAIVALPNYALSYFVKAVVLQAQKRFDEALACYDQALAIDPNYLDALNNRGNLLYEMKQHDLAFASFAEIIKRDDKADKALSNSGIILTIKNQYEESIEYFSRLLKVNPDFDYGRGLLFYSQLHCCDWSEFEQNRDLITEGIQAGKRVCKSLALMAFSDSAGDAKQCAEIFAKHFFPPKPISLWNGEDYQHDKIRIAYVSPDLRQHPVGHLMAGVIENHDKTRFETIGISIGIDDGSSLRARFVAAFDQFYDVQLKTSLDIAQLIRHLEVDVLVDLAGYTADSRTDIFAYRPAPVQVNYLGYPGTMGLDTIDYILADRHVIPEDQQHFYTERVAYLPDTYLPTDGGLKVAERTPTRQEMGLPETGAIFCSFNHDYKITPPIFNVWMRILAQVPGSVLWLMKLHEAAQRNLRKAAQAQGIDPERLIFATRVPLVEDHLARYRLADLFLDTSPYNAHTTASDALLAGLPVLTYTGQTFSGRVAGSLLNAIGMPELITHSLADYEALAVKLATDGHTLMALKAKLAANQKTYPLFNTELFSKNIELAFESMCRDVHANTGIQKAGGAAIAGRSS